jgi:hypothetical protein
MFVAGPVELVHALSESAIHSGLNSESRPKAEAIRKGFQPNLSSIHACFVLVSS